MSFRDFRKRISHVFLVLSGVLLGAMLGQLDIILSPWYTNLSNTLKLPYLFGDVTVSALRAWEILYFLIVLSTLVAVYVGSGDEKVE